MVVMRDYFIMSSKMNSNNERKGNICCEYIHPLVHGHQAARHHHRETIYPAAKRPDCELAS